jgi:prevent-host-death family protein
MFVLEMSPNDKGAIAEQAIVLAATKLRVPVWRPINEHSRADLLMEIAGQFFRVQCKWGRVLAERDVVVAHLHSSRCTPNGYVRTCYAEHEIDLFAVYCAELDRSFLIPIWRVAGMKQIHLRLAPARNGQQSCINLADDFDFEGAVAQLEERVHGMHEVRGSSPLSSTPSDASPTVVGCDDFRVRFSHWLDQVAAGEEVLITRRGKPRIRLSPATGAAAPPALTPPAEARTRGTAPR